jgi:hypothetical protein
VTGQQPLQPPAFDRLLDQIHHLPLWVRQAVFLELKESLEQMMSPNTLRTSSTASAIQLWKPKPTRKALIELHEPSGQYPKSVVYVIKRAAQNTNVLNMALACRWTLQQTCLVLDRCITEDLLIEPEESVLKATINYLCGKTLLGEYLIEMAKIDRAKVQEALMTQSYINDALGEHVMLGDVLISLGYLCPEDSETILFLKQDCEQTYDMVNGLPRVPDPKAPYEQIHHGLPTQETAAAKKQKAASQPGTVARGPAAGATPGLTLPPPPGKVQEAKPTYTQQNTR